jgi:hypothetical protein
MIDIQIETGGDTKTLAELIASTHGEEITDVKLAQVATLLRAHQAEVERTRPSWQQLDTVNFHKLDDDNDWSDV